MKYILLSADGPISLYEVPDKIAKDLTKHCIDFLKWVEHSPKAKQMNKGYFPEKEFIKYLNDVICSNYIYKSKFIKTIANTGEEKIKVLEVIEPYKNYPYFNF